jgi:hypothetical protein
MDWAAEGKFQPQQRHNIFFFSKTSTPALENIHFPVVKTAAE